MKEILHGRSKTKTNSYMQPQQPDRYTHNNRQNRKILQAKNSIVYIDECLL